MQQRPVVHNVAGSSEKKLTDSAKDAELGGHELLDGAGFLCCSHQLRLGGHSRAIHCRDHLFGNTIKSGRRS